MDALIESLRTDGYCVIPRAYGRQDTDQALRLVQHWHDRTRATSSKEVPYLNRGQPMVYNLQNKDPFFLELLFRNQTLERLLVHFLNDRWYKAIPEGQPNYVLRSYLARSSCGALPLHIDSFIPYTGSHVAVMQAVMLLEDAGETNGCTVVVPGSHQSGEYVEQQSRSDAVPITGRAGDLVVWDSRLWHGTTANRSESTRWALIATFSRWWLKQAFDIPRALPPDIYERLTNKQRAVLGFCSTPHLDETEGIDMKRGYDGETS